MKLYSQLDTEDVLLIFEHLGSVFKRPCFFDDAASHYERQMTSGPVTHQVDATFLSQGTKMLLYKVLELLYLVRAPARAI